ncbi:P-loop containing nucleoside triphosphate hydrolase protein [Kalaharituber pfeilii]|nr:P-loop containing nucleoside triphosphate hydrolase protein [Kalaharituber pfeilii]
MARRSRQRTSTERSRSRARAAVGKVEAASNWASKTSKGPITIYEDESGNRKLDIILHDVLAANLRLHQIEGLRFLWKQLVVSKSNVNNSNNSHTGESSAEELAEGALLAHTMGLGKTVTLIAFLFTLAEVLGGLSVRTAHVSLPNHLRAETQLARVLILAPGGLLTNWSLELKTWAAKFPTDESTSCGKKLLSTVYRIGKNAALDQRIKVLKEWHTSGGILLLGHELFRVLVDPRDSTYRTDEQMDDIEQCLLDPGPEIVVADEAHAFKNTQSKISKAVNRIQTPTRIALTASPLSNSLLEYYALMKWVAPESDLGNTVSEFRERFYNPIMAGLAFRTEEEEAYEMANFHNQGGQDYKIKELRRVEMEASAKQGLLGIISASAERMHRRNVDTIKQYLKPKTEFILRVPLTVKQAKLYNNFLRQSFEDKRSVMWRLFCLRALCNHPNVFKIVEKRPVGQRKEEGREGRRKSAESSRTEAKPGFNEVKDEVDAKEAGAAAFDLAIVDNGETKGEQLPQYDENKAQSSNSHLMVPQISSLNSSFSSSTSNRTDISPSPSPIPLPKMAARQARRALTASNKFLVLFTLLAEFKAVGDKTLIFSHSIDTLDYLTDLLHTLNFTVVRLDGSVHFHQRQEDLVSFNRGNYDIYLVSTKAGGVGLNLQSANRVVILDCDHSPVWEQQAIGRSFRLGQKKEVFVYRDEVLDRVVRSTNVITGVRVDEDESTSVPPVGYEYFGEQEEWGEPSELERLLERELGAVEDEDTKSAVGSDSDSDEYEYGDTYADGNITEAEVPNQSIKIENVNYGVEYQSHYEYAEPGLGYGYGYGEFEEFGEGYGEGYGDVEEEEEGKVSDGSWRWGLIGGY